MKGKEKPINIIFKYLSDEKVRLFFYILLVILTYIPAFLTSFFLGFAIEGLIEQDFNKFLLFIALEEGLHIVLYAFLAFPRDYLYKYLELKFNKRVIKDLYHKIQNLPAIAFEDIGVGEFINRLTNDPDRIMTLLSKLIKMACRAFVVVIITIICFSISIYLGLELIIFMFVMGFISWKFWPKVRKTQEEIKKDSDLQVKTETENLTGIREIKSLGIKKNMEERLHKNIDRLFSNERRLNTYELIYNNLNNIIYFVLKFVILLTSGYLVYKGKMAYSILIVVNSYLWKIDEVVESISDFGINYSKVKVSLKRINEILNNKLYKDEQFGDKVINDAKGVIEFKNVKFKYRDDEDYVLNNFSVKFESNKKIAIVGRSGNGKSTVFNLLLRYFDPSSGTILFDNVDLKELTEESLRNNISIIRQSPFIFNLSIMENFKIVKKDVTLEEVRNACKKAYLDDYIMSLPKKYDTIIGEGGVNLSGGQRQRLAIARTLIINTKVILFDEATSALDNESQEYIKQTIDNLIKDHTVIVVAHRLSTIVDSDVIHVIEKGELQDSGTHKELLEKCKTYRALYYSESNID